MMCVGKDAATYALLPNAVKTPQLTGDNTYYNANNKKVSRVDMWNPSSEIRCYVKGDMIEGIAESEINVLQVWDRTNDTKYYRRMAVGNADAKVFHNGDTIINATSVSTNVAQEYADTLALPIKKGQKAKITYVNYKSVVLVMCK
jgi:hypothetical protein